MQTIARTIQQIMKEQPYYGLFACGLNKRFVEPQICDTACVSLNGINFELSICPEFWEEYKDYRYGIILHELLHICLFHVTDAHKLFGHLCSWDLLNLALDLTVESYVPEQYWLKKPNGDLVGSADKLFTMLNLPKKQGTRYYIDVLKKLQPLSQQHQQSSSGNNTSNSNKGNSSKQPKTGDSLIDTYNNLSEEDKSQINSMLQEKRHLSWKDISDLPKEQQELIKKQAEFQLKEAAKSIGRGNVPGELAEIIDQLFKVQPPIFNWKAYFRRLLGVSFDVNQKKTRRKESLRFEDSPGLKLRKKHKILVAIDTSGSVNTEEFKDFFSEIYHIWRSGADIHCLECDMSITNEYDYKGKMPTKISGRGGTSFIPCIDYYNTHRRDYTACVYFTDGYGDQDKCKPLGKMLWVITSDGAQDNNDYPGVKICIPKKIKQ